MLSDKQQTLLQQIVRRTTNSYRLVRRAQVILWSTEGVSNTEIAQRLQWSRNSVRLWRLRWQAATPSLTMAEAEGMSDLSLMQRLSDVLSDDFRSGTPARFSLEQIVEVVARGLVKKRPQIVNVLSVIGPPLNSPQRQLNEALLRAFLPAAWGVF